MFKQILIPLDGSGLAETVLPLAVKIAASLSAEVTLLHIIEKDVSPLIHGDQHLTTTRKAGAYLEVIRRQHFPRDMTVSTHVHTTATRNVADSIINHQTELNPDLIIICTHGRSGLRQILFGSIAEQVVESGRTPVLLIRPQAATLLPSRPIQTLLAAADDDPEHGQGLRTALEFGLSIGARVHVVGVVPTIGTLAGRRATAEKFMPATTYQFLEMADKELAFFLRQKIQSLSQTDADVTLEIGRGDPATIIAKTAQSVTADIIILGTQGKTGAKAIWSGSTAAKVIRQTSCPLLLVPVKKDVASS